MDLENKDFHTQMSDMGLAFFAGLSLGFGLFWLWGYCKSKPVTSKICLIPSLPKCESSHFLFRIYNTASNICSLFFVEPIFFENIFLLSSTSYKKNLFLYRDFENQSK